MRPFLLSLLAVLIFPASALASAPVLTAEGKTLHWTDVPATAKEWRLEVMDCGVPELGGGCSEWGFGSTYPETPREATPVICSVEPCNWTPKIHYRVREYKPVLGTVSNEVVIEYPPASSMRVGIDTGGWWVFNDTALMAGKKLVLRSQNSESSVLSNYESHGFTNIDLIGHNPATTVNAEALANEAVARARAHPGNVAEEILNEPQNPYLGGSESQANWEAYARVFNTVADKFVAEGIKAVPLWSADGGFKGIPTWGAHVWPLLDANAKRIGRPTEHPYGGTGERAKSALGGRGRVEEAFALTGLKSWVTEVGWPTCVGCEPTGDSLQWTEAEQAANIESFLTWAPAWCEDVTIFQYRDYSPNNYYGIETSGGTHKLSYGVLQAFG